METKRLYFNVDARPKVGEPLTYLEYATGECEAVYTHRGFSALDNAGTRMLVADLVYMGMRVQVTPAHEQAEDAIEAESTPDIIKMAWFLFDDNDRDSFAEALSTVLDSFDTKTKITLARAFENPDVQSALARCAQISGLLPEQYQQLKKEDA